MEDALDFIQLLGILISVFCGFYFVFDFMFDFSKLHEEEREFELEMRISAMMLAERQRTTPGIVRVHADTLTDEEIMAILFDDGSPVTLESINWQREGF